MPIEFACEHCSRTLRVPDGSAGRQSQCPACHHIQQVPDATTEPAGAVADGRLSIPCPKCKHLLVCAPELLGTRGQCKQCQHIFTISPVPEIAAANEPVRLVFHCPQCQQLFEGREEMRGRKGKCHACQAVFPIELENAAKLKEPGKPTEEPHSTAAVIAPGPTSPAYPPSRPQRKAAVSKSGGAKSGAPKLGSPKTGSPKTGSQASHQAKFQFPQPANAREPVLAGATAAEAAGLSPAALQRRTLQLAGSATSPGQAPIRFMCAQCHGLMEVPGSSVGMETACPYCHTVQNIPAKSHEEEGGLLEALSLAPDPLANFGSSPAALQQQWSTQSLARHRSDLTVGNVFQSVFENLFPSCLVTPLHVLVVGLSALVAWGIVFGTLWALVYAIRPTRDTAIVLAFICFGIYALITLTLMAWFSAAIRHMALRAVRKQPFDMVEALSTGGAYGASLFVLFLITLLSLFIRAPQLIEMMAPGTLGWLAVIWTLVAIPLVMIVQALFSLSWFAAIDGDGAGEAIGTSCGLVLKHFPVMVGVKVLVWLITIPLAVLTLGFALVLPIYTNAALYNLARKQ